MHKSREHKYHAQIKCRPALIAHSHWYQRVGKNLIGLRALSLFSPLPFPFLSPLHEHAHACVRRARHTHKHTDTQLNLYCHPPANWHQLLSCILTHAYTLLSQSFVCKVAGCDGLLGLLLPGYVTRCFTSIPCQRKGVIVGMYVAEEHSWFTVEGKQQRWKQSGSGMDASKSYGHLML